jgi:hypothetical protein
MEINSVKDVENAVKNNPYRIISIDKQFKTRTVCEIAVTAKGILLKHVLPEHRNDIDLCVKALQSCKQGMGSIEFENIKQHIPTKNWESVLTKYKLDQL